MKRKSYKQVQENKKLKQTEYYPILYWNEADIWDYTAEQNIPYCSIYDEGSFDRIGCVVCPQICRANQGKLNAHKQRWPKHYRAFEKAMRTIYDKGKPTGKPWRESTFEEFLSNWYRGK